VNQRFVIAIFIGRAELQMPVQEELKSRSPAGNDDPLVLRSPRIDYVIGKQLIF
jgi:hypothetical protein